VLLPLLEIEFRLFSIVMLVLYLSHIAGVSLIGATAVIRDRVLAVQHNYVGSVFVTCCCGCSTAIAVIHKFLYDLLYYYIFIIYTCTSMMRNCYSFSCISSRYQ
jgi:hypothetical protein